jgi:hypothetical protein
VAQKKNKSIRGVGASPSPIFTRELLRAEVRDIKLVKTVNGIPGRQISASCSASVRAVCYYEESSLVSACVYTNSEASHIWTHRKRCRIDSDALGPHTAVEEREATTISSRDIISLRNATAYTKVSPTPP